MPEMVAALQAGGWSDVEDEPAIIRAARIDPRAFAPLYDRYRDRVYWYLRTRTSTSEDAADLLQQVFLHALDRIDQYKAGKGPFAGWLFGIARNLAINHHRQRKVAASWDLLPDALRSSQGSDPETQAVQTESLEWLAWALSGLDQSKRELLILRYIIGLSFADIAAAVGKSETAVRQQVSRTLRVLKEQGNDNA